MKNMAVSTKFARVSTVCFYLAFINSKTGGDGVPRSFVEDLIGFYRVSSKLARVSCDT